MAVIDRQMAHFYETCGYKEEMQVQCARSKANRTLLSGTNSLPPFAHLQKVVRELATQTFDDHVKAIVADAFLMGDVNADSQISAPEFIAWAEKNRWRFLLFLGTCILCSSPALRRSDHWHVRLSSGGSGSGWITCPGWSSIAWPPPSVSRTS